MRAVAILGQEGVSDRSIFQGDQLDSKGMNSFQTRGGKTFSEDFHKQQ